MRISRLVLVVEDEPALRTIYEQILGSAGYEVLQAADGEEALAILADTAPEIVVLDMLLPKVDGGRVLEYMRSAPHLNHTGIVIATAHDRFRHAENVSVNDRFLLKPIRPQELLNAASQAVLGWE